MTGRPRTNRSLATWIATAALVVTVTATAWAEDSKDKPEAADAPPPLVFEKRPDPPPPPAPVDRTSRWRPYASEVHARVDKYIKENREIFGSDFYFYVQLWIDPQGRIVKTNQLSPSGRHGVDALITKNFGSELVFPPPPKEMPMPITISIKKRQD